MSAQISLLITAQPTDTLTQQEAEAQLAEAFEKYPESAIADVLITDIWTNTDAFVSMTVEKTVPAAAAGPARVIHIEPTDAQWATIDGITGGHHPFLVPVGEGVLHLEHTVDDTSVRLYVIQPDGSYTYEELEGLGQGWSGSLNADGTPVESEHDESLFIEGESM